MAPRFVSALWLLASLRLYGCSATNTYECKCTLFGCFLQADADPSKTKMGSPPTIAEILQQLRTKHWAICCCTGRRLHFQTVSIPASSALSDNNSSAKSDMNLTATTIELWHAFYACGSLA